MLVVSWFTWGIIYYFLYCYLFCNIICKERFKINSIGVILSIVFGLIYFLLMNNNFQISRPFILHSVAFVFLLMTYRKTVINTLISVLYTLFILLISEAIYVLIVTFIFNITVETFNAGAIGYFISNFTVMINALILSKLSRITNFFEFIVSWTSKRELLNLYASVLLALVIVIFITYYNFINVLPSCILLITNIICLAIIFFIINYFKERTNNNRIINEYDHLLGYVQKYEKVIEEKSKSQHEYKNQLILLKSVVSKNNKKALGYIDELYTEFKDNDDIELLKKLKYLPSGGLKGLIYYKLEEMYEKGINVFVDISLELKNMDIDKTINRNLKDISKVIGVYIDNAIEACVESKEKYLVFEVYCQNELLVFSISNTYSNVVDLSRVDQEGYTTKGDGKGYGLSLVKDIIEHNDELSQSRELNGIYYVQKLYIKK